MSNAFQFFAPVGDQSASRDSERSAINTRPLIHEVQAIPFQPPTSTLAEENQRLMDMRVLPPLSLYAPDIPPRLMHPISREDTANPISRDRNAITTDPSAEQRRLDSANPIQKDRNAIK